MRIDLLDAAASGMDAQRAALDVAARNVAAAEAAGPNADYARMIPDFRVLDSDDGDARVEFAGTHTERGTNVDILTEMIAVMNASRAYESDASIFDVGKTLADRTIELERL
jgi:flagellar basal body rod protein FlgC